MLKMFARSQKSYIMCANSAPHWREVFNDQAENNPKTCIYDRYRSSFWC